MSDPVRRELKPSVRVPEAACPYCGDKQDRATGFHTRYPAAGDLSVCIQCGGVSVYTGETLQREPWPKDEPIPADVQTLQRAIRQRLS
jgi:hypothetical protein